MAEMASAEVVEHERCGAWGGNLALRVLLTYGQINAHL